MLIASLFVQIFALVSPLFFQVVIDKVLNSTEAIVTLYVLVAGLAAIGLFDVMLQYLRTYALVTVIVLATIPLYVLIAAMTRPLLREKLTERFNRGAESQQFLVEFIVGMQTIKVPRLSNRIAAAHREERLAACVRAAFKTTMPAAKGQKRHPIYQWR